MEKTGIIITFIIASCITANIGISLLYWNATNQKIVDMVKDGVDPVAAICAIQDDYGKMPVCIALAAKDK